MPLINNKLGYFINILNFIHQITFSIIIKVGFLIKGLIKICSLQEVLPNFVISKFFFELFVNQIFLVKSLCALDFLCLNIKYMIHSTFFQISRVIITLMYLKYMLFICLIQFSFYEKHE